MKNLYAVEKKFDNVFQEIDYARVADDLSANPTFQNADYINKTIECIVELKILDKNFFENGGLIDSLGAYLLKPESITENGLGLYSFQLPDLNREGKHDSFEEPLRRVLKKANRQIKETRNYYNYNSKSSGFVVLALVGLNTVSPEVVAVLARKLISHEFSSINGLIVCTPGYIFKNQVSQIESSPCVSVTDESNLYRKQLCMQIADKIANSITSNVFQI